MKFIGIDPGKSGAVAWVSDGLVAPGFFKLDGTDADVWRGFQGLRDYGAMRPDETMALIEKVHAMPGQGVTSMFTFGYSAGLLHAYLIASIIPFAPIRPQTWQKHHGLSKKYATKTARKNAHKARAQELFPGMRITHANADALLIAATCEALYRREK